MKLGQRLCGTHWKVWFIRASDSGHFFCLQLLLGPRVQDEGSVLLIAETVSITFNADLAVGPFEGTLDVCKVSGLMSQWWGVKLCHELRFFVSCMSCTLSIFQEPQPSLQTINLLFLAWRMLTQGKFRSPEISALLLRGS